MYEMRNLNILIHPSPIIGSGIERNFSQSSWSGGKALDGHNRGKALDGHNRGKALDGQSRGKALDGQS